MECKALRYAFPGAPPNDKAGERGNQNGLLPPVSRMWALMRSRPTSGSSSSACPSRPPITVR